MIRSTIREILSFPDRLRARRELASRELCVPAGGPVLNYGGVLAGDDLVAGGRVKLLHLRERWPEAEHFNILYLVSSAPPACGGELVRWAKARGAKFVWNQNGVGFPAWAGRRTAEINRPMSALLHAADHVVYQSEFCRESAVRWLGAPHAPASVLINPADTALFSPAPHAPDGHAWRLLAAGTHHQPYRVLGALEALRVLLDAGHSATLTVAGEMRWPGAHEEAHAAISRLRLAERVTLRPGFTQEEAVALYQSAHVLLHLKYADPCPTVVVESLACGVPVVALRGGGMPELLGDDGGEMIYVEPSWEKATYPPPRRVAAAVARIMREWPARSAAARARAVACFEKEAWVTAHAGIFGGLLC